MEFGERKYVIGAIILVVGLIFTIRLFYIQVLDEQWVAKGANISERKIVLYPARGLIYDRNGKLLVGNTAVYDLMVIPKDINDLDTNLFCRTVGITREQFEKKMEAASSYSRYKPSIFEKQIPANEYGK